MEPLIFIAGIFLLYFGDKLVYKNALLLFLSSKKYTKIYSTAIITSLPELIVALYASSIGLYSIAIGTLFGSSIALFLLGLGLPAIIKTVTVSAKTCKKTYIHLIIAIILFGFFISNDLVLKRTITFSHIESLILLLLAFIYVYFLIKNVQIKKVKIRKNANVIELFIGFILLILGAILSIDAVEKFSLIIEISPYTISVILLGLGVALPEIIENMLKVKRNIRLIENNILISVIFNIIFILPLTSLFFGPIALNYSQAFDGLFIVIASIFIFPWSLKKDIKVDQVLGIILIVLYIIFSISAIIKSF